MRGLPRDVKSALNKARESALLAVETYNRPGTAFRSGGYIILMIVAWTALFHAIFIRRRMNPFYIRVSKGRYKRYEKIDGENKAWELAECIRRFYGSNNPPARKNLEFFIGLRNKIEHRSMPQLDDQIFGECQALLLNFESLLNNEFGAGYSLNESLAVSLQFSSISPQAKSDALRKMQSRAYPSVKSYVDRFRSGLSDEIIESMEYSFKVFMIPKTGNHAKSSDMAVEFINLNALSDEERQKYEKVVAIIKPRETEVAHPGLYKPGDIRTKVEEGLGHKFTMNDHTKCWKHYKVRPKSGDSDLTKCDTNYCQYDMPHRDYIYTKEWADFLIDELSDAKKYNKVLGKIKPSKLDTYVPQEL